MELGGMAEEHEIPKTAPSKPRQSVQGYVSSALSRGFTKSDIKNALIKRGWKEPTVKRLFGE